MSKIEFNRRRAAVIPDLRPMYKIAKILMILALCCSGKKASLLKLHLLNWALLDSQRFKALKLSAEQKKLLLGVWGIDPSLNMALQFAVSEKLILRLANGSFQLSDLGLEFMNKSNMIGLLPELSLEMKALGKGITEKMVNEAVRKWNNEI
ncbi:hypothetical protein L1077_24400 [Pseudoalteromonas luteoviolacea]|uniref:hypothetical protein n=1 Tax=Pseudoalteromonas luteoviolacea TaxID=43657 RepID=UPI001F405EB6|nr:hypothetical protein [Pseudoalteromonas luteoviolacea]MCF6442566.1 hypothetical protein [Pseudoalteromonas luteoviolacea]